MYQVTVKNPTLCRTRMGAEAVAITFPVPAGFTVNVTSVKTLPNGEIELEQPGYVSILVPNSEIEVQRIGKPKVLAVDTRHTRIAFQTINNVPVPYTQFGSYTKNTLAPFNTYVAEAVAHSNGEHRFYVDSETVFVIKDEDMVNVRISETEITTFTLVDAF